MKKLKLNKKTISALDKKQMGSVNGGKAEFTSMWSCRRTKRHCCNDNQTSRRCISMIE